MSSIKCPECGLVNFSTALECKRCKYQLNEFATIAEQRPYQTNVQEVQAFPTQPFHQNQPAAFQSYQVPPPPPTFHNAQAQQDYQQPGAPPPLCCVKCGGSKRDVYIQNFKKDYVPPAAYLGLFLGLIPMLILVLVLKVSHQLSAPFCGECWTNFRKVTTVETLTTLGFFALFVGGIMMAMSRGSGFIFVVCLGLSVGLVIWGHIFKKNNSPKYKRVSRHQVVIDDPTYGEVCFQR